MQISKRLEAVAGMVTPGCKIADIGTDHAYIPIYLVSRGISPGALAMDVNRGPLEKAVTHICQYGLSDRIETRLSDGLKEMQPGEADSIVIAGMGGPLTIRILTDGADRAAAAEELILQPQSEIRLVRAYLEETGYRIVQEDMICEEGKFYPMMKAVRIGDGNGMTIPETQREADTCRCAESKAAERTVPPGMSDAELRYGPLLMEAKHPVLKEYLLREKELTERILAALDGKNAESSAVRRSEVEYERKLILETLTLFADQEQTALLEK